jgi:hypothetical protein
MVQCAVQTLGVMLLMGCATGFFNFNEVGMLRCQAQGSATDTVYPLRGTVVDGTTGKPLERALVASVDRRLATLTDSEGRFSVSLSVPAGQQRWGAPCSGSWLSCPR